MRDVDARALPSALILFFSRVSQAYLFSGMWILSLPLKGRLQARRCLQSQIKREALFSQRSSNGLGKEMDSVLPHKLTRYESFRPEIDDEATALLKGMASATAEEVGAGVRAIRLGNGVKFLRGKFPAGDTIYERGFYPRLVSAIRGLAA